MLSAVRYINFEIGLSIVKSRLPTALLRSMVGRWNLAVDKPTGSLLNL